MIRIEDIIEKASAYCDDGDIKLLRKAYVFSARAHKEQVRRSGEPYLVHPLEVAAILVSLRLDAITIATGLLHDVLEDTLTDAATLRTTFGDDVVRLVEGVTKIGKIEFVSKEAAQAENFRKMLLAMVDDIRVILVKLADRLHNMRTLGFLPEAKRQRIASETLDIYAAIANRLGMGRIKGELEDLSFRHLFPTECSDLERRIEEKRQLSREFIDSVRGKLIEACQGHGLEVEIEGRVKRLYSISQKMRRQGIRLEEVYDYLAFRVLTDNVKDCYAVLGVVHGAWTPIPGRIKDYIAMPKANLYQSIHTTLMSDQGHPFEVQIRTHAMNQIAEEGIAAHWRYKEGRSSSGADERTYAWLRSLVELGKDVRDPREFLDSLRVDLYRDEVYAFTPQGKVMAFPRGSTPIDLAYAIHTDLGHQCVGARINGKLVPLRTALKNGDIVEILRDKTHRPSRDWLKVVGTTRARSKIRQWLNNEARDSAVELGKAMLERELRRLHVPIGSVDDRLSEFLPGLGVSKVEDLHAAIGYGRVEARPLAQKLRQDDGVNEPVAGDSPQRGGAERPGDSLGIEVRGHGDMLVVLARCCNPIPGDGIVGYITRGRGVSVHAVDCRNVRHLLYDPGRQIEVSWTGVDARAKYQVGLRIRTEDHPGMLAKISARIANRNTDIRHVEAKTFEDKKGLIKLTLEISDLAHLESVCRSIAEIDGVLAVERVAE